MAKERIYWNEEQSADVAIACVLLQDLEPELTFSEIAKEVQAQLLPPELHRNIPGISQFGRRTQEVLESMLENLTEEGETLSTPEAAVSEKLEHTPTPDLLTEMMRRQNQPIIEALENLNSRISGIEGVFLDVAVGISRLGELIGNSELKARLEELVKPPIEVPTTPPEDTRSEPEFSARDKLVVIGCHTNTEALLRRNYPDVKFNFFNGEHPKKLGNVLASRSAEFPVLVGPHRHSLIIAKLRARNIGYRAIPHNHAQDWLAEVERLFVAKRYAQEN